MEFKSVRDSSARLYGRFLKGPAVVFAAQRGDEVLGCGGALRKLVLGNERALLVIVNRDDQDTNEITGSGGSRVDRTAATRAAAELLGYTEPIFWNVPAPGFSYREETVQRILDVIAGFGASIVYAPSLDEPRHDRFALALAAREAVRRRADDCALAFYGVDTPVSANQVLDIGDVSPRKKQAIDCFQATEARILGAEASPRMSGKPAWMLRPEIDTTEGFDFWLPQRLVDPIPKLSRPERWENDGTPAGNCLVSVVIRSTGRETLADALDSIAAQTYPAIEVLLVDVEGRGSLATGDRCGRFPMRTVSEGRHLGRGAAANAGIDAAEGDYAVFLDDDDWFLPDHVHSLVSILSGTDDARAAYSGIECRRRNEVGVWEVLRVFDEPYDRTRLLVENYIPIHAVLFDRGLFGAQLRFDESFNVYEDWDFWLQLTELTPLVRIERVTAIYRISESSGLALRNADPEVGPGYSALLKKWRSRWSSEQLIAIANRASKSAPKAIPGESPVREGANTSGLRRRIFELEQTATAYKVRARELEEARHARDARISELEQAAGTREERIAELEGSVAEDELHIGDLQSELTSKREQEHELVALKNQVLQVLNGIQTSASGQLALPLRALESRWPRLVRGVAALPKFAWWVLTLRLPERLRVRRLANELLATGLFDRIWYVENNPDVILDGRNPLFHWLAQGWTDGRDPNPLFDTDWYLEQNPDVAESGINPLEHYLKVGADQGRDPCPLFDTDWYSAQYPDVAESGMNPLAHFLSRGAAEGRAGQPQPQPDVATASSEPYVALYDRMLDNAERLPCDSEYMPEADVAVDSTSLSVRLIAFYLPQFHPIPENDKWWGAGFTEWTNVTKAVPQFEGHYQPRLPGALGFYDLRVKEVQREQIRIAKKHGIYGFCYHHYWFGGKQLLERPLQQVLEDPSLDFPFCVCWANENWTRRWDGYDREVLIGQDHSVEDDFAFIAELEPALRDPRYIRIGGRPLLIVYRPQLFPDPAATAAHWRQYARDRKIPEPYLVNVRSFPEVVDPASIGFDAAVEFPPHQYPWLEVTHRPSLLNRNFGGKVLDYRACVDEAEARVSGPWPFELFPGVMTAWDNTPRTLNRGAVFSHASPGEYRRWLSAACRRAVGFREPAKRLVFVNAWNEWAEGTYLEPDRKFGFAYLRATADVLSSFREAASEEQGARTNDQCTSQPMVSVIVPNYNHAGFLRQRLDSIYEQSYRNIEVLLLDDCSTDSSRDILKEYASRFPSITRTYYNAVNSGSVFRQWRKGLELARGELVWVAESDDYCDLNFLEILVEALEDEAVLLAYARHVFVDEDGTAHNGSFEDYVGVVDERKWTQCYVNTAHDEVRHALGARNTIPNVSGTLFRKPESLALLDDPEWLEMRIAGDWVFYLHLLLGGKIAYSVDTNSYFRFHSRNTSVATYATDAYYREHGIVARYTALLYDVPEATLRHNYEITRNFYREFVTGGSDQAFDALFRYDRVLEARAGRSPNVMISALAFIPGGAEVTPILVANELKRRGLSVLFHSCDFSPDNERIRCLLRDDVPVVRAASAAEFKRVVDQFGIEVVNTHHHGSQRFSLEDPAVFSGVRHIGTLHGVYENIEIESPETVDRELAPIDQGVDAWTYVAKKNLAPFHSRGLYSSDRFFHVPNGIDPGKIVPVGRQDMNVPGDAFVLCIVSRGVPEKGWLEGVEIVRRARELSARDIHLILVGDGPVYEQLSRDGTEPFVHVVGFHDHPIDFLAMADMGFLPSRYRGESMPNSLIECFFAGRPAIASDLGEIRNMLSVDGGIAGAVIPVEGWELDIAAASDQVSLFASDPERYDRARELVPRLADRYRIDKVVDAYLEVFTRRSTEITPEEREIKIVAEVV